MNMSYFETEEGRESVLSSTRSLEEISESLKKLTENASCQKTPSFAYVFSVYEADSTYFETTLFRSKSSAVKELRNCFLDEIEDALHNPDFSPKNYEDVPTQDLADAISLDYPELVLSIDKNAVHANVVVPGRRIVYLEVSKKTIR